MTIQEKSITFKCEDLEIEGRLHTAGPQGVVVTHPHPLYGGDMYNAVVEMIVGAFQDLGFSSLRFNFRGVGSSQGTFDNGRGEIQDIQAAMNHMAQIGIETAFLAGYSFGAWVSAQLAPQALGDTALVMVSPPVAFIQFKNRQPIPNLKLVITGDQDEIAPEQMVREQLAGWDPAAHLEIISGADHFYSGCLPNLAETLKTKIALKV